MTSAPWSARICVQYGPPSTRVRSITRNPVMAPETTGELMEKPSLTDIACAGVAPICRATGLQSRRQCHPARSCMTTRRTSWPAKFRATGGPPNARRTASADRSDDSEADVDIAAGGIGIRAHLMRLFHQRGRFLLGEARQRDG